ncbi:MAG: o-succinylbenzoate synthase [Rhodoglobus sp.]
MFPPLNDLLTTSRVVTLPLVSRFRGLDQREALLMEGPQGWTEFSPFAEYDDPEASHWLAAALDFGWNPAPPMLRDTIRVNATLPAILADRVADFLDRFPGCRTVKIKVAEPGQSRADDVARVAAVRKYLGPEGRIRVDANGAWSIDQAEKAIHALAEFDLEYVEQPCRTIDELAQVRQRVHHLGILIAADESVRRAEDPLAVARAGAADILIIKAQPLGGISAALAIIAAAGLPAVVSSALETSVGLSLGLHLAGVIPGLDVDCGLATASLLAADVTHEPLLPIEGKIPVRRVTPSAELLSTHAATPDRTDWWRDRLSRCYEQLANAPATQSPL